MAIQRDWLLRIIERLGEAIAAWASGGSSEQVEVALQELAGLSIERADAMPAWALERILGARTDRTPERMEAVARILEAFAAQGEPALAEARHAKANALRTAAAEYVQSP